MKTRLPIAALAAILLAGALATGAEARVPGGATTAATYPAPGQLAEYRPQPGDPRFIRKPGQPVPTYRPTGPQGYVPPGGYVPPQGLPPGYRPPTYGGPGQPTGQPIPTARQPIPLNQAAGVVQAQVPGGRIVHSHMAEPYYYFRVVSPRGNIVDVVVDRYTGRVVSVRGGP
jgi:hypothetical protein